MEGKLLKFWTSVDLSDCKPLTIKLATSSSRNIGKQALFVPLLILGNMTNTHRRGDVAIIGMACRVAGANTTGRLWENLASSVDVQRVNPRFSGFFSENGGPKKGHTNVDRGYYVDDDLERFDNAFFAIPPIEAGSMDPQQRMLLEVTYEAVENAGLPLARFTGTNTAVYTGTWD